MRGARLLQATLFFCVFSLLSIPTAAQDDPVRVKIRSIPADVTLWQNDKQIPKDPRDGVYFIGQTNEGSPFELRSPGHHPKKIDIKLSSGQKEITLPAEEGRIVYLQPQSLDVEFASEPSGSVFLQTGQDVQLLGQSGEAVTVPLSTDRSGSLTFVFETPGYRARFVELKVNELESGRYPSQGAVELEPLFPLLSPVLRFLALRRTLSLSVLALLVVAVGVVSWKLYQARTDKFS